MWRPDQRLVIVDALCIINDVATHPYTASLLLGMWHDQHIHDGTREHCALAAASDRLWLDPAVVDVDEQYHVRVIATATALFHSAQHVKQARGGRNLALEVVWAHAFRAKRALRRLEQRPLEETLDFLEMWYRHAARSEKAWMWLRPVAVQLVATTKQWEQVLR